MFSILRTKRGKAIVGGITGVGIVGGTAVAAILLTTSISGNTSTVIDSTGPGPQKSFVVSVAATNSAKLICDGNNGEVDDALVLNADGSALTFNPLVRKPADQPTPPVAIDSCTITVTIHNTGDVPVKISDATLSLPTGWTVGPLAGDARGFVAPDATATASALLTANTDAAEDALSGSLTYAYNDAP